MENISVSVRVRPLNRQEGQEFFAWRIDGNSIVQLDPNTRDVDRTRDTKYGLDHVFGPEWTTAQIYEATTQSLIQKMVSGFNSTVFAYGQTSSGKTHTMRGTPDSPGLIPLAVAEAFRLIESNDTREFLIRVSYMELYNEEVNDLLAPENMKLPIHESKENGPYVCGLREDIVTSPEQVLELLESGEANRHIGSTKMNEKSSRSHTIFRMVVESRAVNAESEEAGAVLVSVLTLVDLAGSERVAKTGAEGIRMKEGTAINKSLLTLGNVINKLSEGALINGSHIPYRDSKLTRILQPSLGGNAKTAIICAMTPAMCHVEESHSTLRFACRAKRVVNNAVVNEVLSDAAVLKRQAKEIEELKKRLLQSGGTGGHDSEQINTLRAQLLRSEQEKELMRVKLQEEQLQREKAQKEAEMAKKIMFSTRDEPGEAPSRKQNRRETWCPGKSAWAAPAVLPAAAETPTQSGGTAEQPQRKRSLGRPDGAAPSKSIAELSTLLEEDEEEGDYADGPTPQRRRREYSAAPSDDIQEEEEEDASEDGAMRRSIERVMAALPQQERLLVNRIFQERQELEERVANLQQDLFAAQQASAQHEENARCARESLDAALQQKDTLAQNLEQVKWQSRKLDKGIEDLQTQLRTAKQEYEALVASSAEAQANAKEGFEELDRRHKELVEALAGEKDKVKSLKAELSDTRAKLELRDYEAGLREAKDAANVAQVEELMGKLKERAEELEVARRNLQGTEERAAAAEARTRELYDINKRLEVHVSELESRKRAPLYQKKQEEELKAAQEKAQECEVRAIDAELRLKEVREELEAARKRITELQDDISNAARQAARAQEELAERHALDVQRLTLEGTLQKERHEEAVASLRASIHDLEAEKAALEGKVAAKDMRIAEVQQDAADLRSRIADLEATEAELQACAVAARDKIALLEHAAEEETTAHEAALAAQEQARQEALASASAQHEQALASVLAQHERTLASASAQHEQVKASLEETLAGLKNKIAELEEELRAERQRAAEVVQASLSQSQEATAKEQTLRSQLAELQAKVSEAAGALKVKEELKEERQKVASLKTELQKLQLESKTGAKGKDLAQKELEALKKRLTETEAKLKVAVQEKTNALQEKSNLERQLKQNQSQKMMIEKTLEKKDAMESKKRESIMVNLNKSKEQLNSSEERIKSLTVEIQKLQMDLTAKQSECRTLEEQVRDQRAENEQLREENNKLDMDNVQVRHELECSQKDAKETLGQLESTASELEAARTAAGLQLEELERVRAELAGAISLAEGRQATIETMRQQQAELEAALTTAQSAAAAIEEARKALEEAQELLRAEAAKLQEALTAKTEQEQALADELAAAQHLLASTQKDLAETTSAHACAQERLEALEAACTSLRAELQESVMRRSKLEEDAERQASQLVAAQAEAESNVSARAVMEGQLADLSSKLAAMEEEAVRKLLAAETEAQRLSEQLSATDAERQRLLSELSTAAAELERLSSSNAALELVQLNRDELASQLAEAHSERKRLESQLTAAGEEAQRLQLMLAAQEVAASSAAQDAGHKLAEAGSEVQRLTEQLDATSARVQQLQSELAAQQAEAFSAAQEAARKLAEAGSEGQLLKEKIAGVNEQVQQLQSELAAHQHAASDTALDTVQKLASADAENRQLTALLSAATEHVQQLQSELLAQRSESSAAAQLAADKLADLEQQVRQLVDKLAVTEQAAQQLRSDVANQRQASADAATLAARSLDDMAAQNEELRRQLQFLQREDPEAVAQAASATADLQAELERSRQQLSAAQLEADALRAEAGRLTAQIQALEEQLARPIHPCEPQGAPAPLGAEPMHNGNDTTGLLSSPAVRLPRSPSRGEPDGPSSAAFQQQLADYAAELELARAALAAELQRSRDLELELASARDQAVHDHSVAALTNTTSDVTRSLAAAGMTRLQVINLQQQVNQLHQELKDMEFARDEDRAAAAAEQHHLKAMVAAAQGELTRCRQRISELEEKLMSAESAANMQNCSSAAHVPTADGTMDAEARPEAASPVDERPAAKLDSGAADARLAELEVRAAELDAQCSALQAKLLEEQAQKERLTRLVEDLSVKVASAPTAKQLPDEREQQSLQEAAQLAAMERALLEAQTSAVQLQATIDEQAVGLQRLESIKHEYSALVQQHSSLQKDFSLAQQELSQLQAAYKDLLALSGAKEPGAGVAGCHAQVVDAEAECRRLKAEVEQLQQRRAELEAEMSDVQAACNVATAEKMTLERDTAHRVLELELANIRLQDELAKLRPGDAISRVDSSASAKELESFFAERDQLKERVQALEQALKDAGLAAEATRDAALRATEAEAKLSSLQCSLEDLTVRNAHLQAELDAKSAALDAVRQDACRQDAARSQAEEQGTELRGALEELRRELSDKQAALHEAMASHDEAFRKLSAANDAVTEREADVARLVNEATALAEAKKALEEDMQDLVDENTKHELEKHDLRNEIAALKAQLAFAATVESNQAEVAAITARLRESEARNSKLEERVLELTQQLSAVSEQLRGLLCERAELENARGTAVDERHRLEAEKLAVEKRLGDLQQEVAELKAQIGHMAAAHDEDIHEIKLEAQQREAQFNAHVQELQSKVEWLQEDLRRAQQEAAQQAAAAAETAQALRLSKRGELKLTALMYRIRQDLQAGQLENYDKLYNIRSLQYDVDMWTEKYKRAVEKHGAEKRQLQEVINSQGEELAAARQHLGGGKALALQVATTVGARVLVDKENMPGR